VSRASHSPTPAGHTVLLLVLRPLAVILSRIRPPLEARSKHENSTRPCPSIWAILASRSQSLADSIDSAPKRRAVDCRELNPRDCSTNVVDVALLLLLPPASTPCLEWMDHARCSRSTAALDITAAAAAVDHGALSLLAPMLLWDMLDICIAVTMASAAVAAHGIASDTANSAGTRSSAAITRRTRFAAATHARPRSTASVDTAASTRAVSTSPRT